MLIDGRKFDIRMWVLVTDWNPLTIWIWDNVYIKFAVLKYCPTKIDNVFMHLTNNAISKKFNDFKYTSSALNVEETMWHDC